MAPQLELVKERPGGAVVSPTDPGDPVVTDIPRWNLATLIAFRFSTCYFGAFGAALVVGLIPIVLTGIGVNGAWPAMRGMFRDTKPPVEWAGSHLLGLHVQSAQVGSDSAFQWSVLFCIAALSATATTIWTVLDRHRHSYGLFRAWVLTILRLVLAIAMFYFGMAKVFPTQMPFVLNRLVEPYGNFSPEGVLWAQVGISQPYEILLGLAEVLGGLLLLLPCAAAAGALVCAVDLTQVFILNMTYDIRLKTVSSQLLLLSLFLLAPSARRIFAAVLTDHAIPASNQVPLFNSSRAGQIALAAQISLGLVLLGAFGGQGWRQLAQPTPDLYGIWRVERFSAEGYQRDPLLTDDIRWRRVVFDKPFHVSDPVVVTVQHMDDSFEVFGGTIDPRRHYIDLGHRIELGTFKETPVRIRLTYWWPGPADQMIIDGDDFAGHRIHLRVTRLDPGSFPLTERGFNWVQEHPYNR